MVIEIGRISKTLNEVKSFKNMNKNPESFLVINLVQKEVPPSQKVQNHAYVYKRKTLTQKAVII